jgi:membrane protease YdiL (CAAX protease family)
MTNQAATQDRAHEETPPQYSLAKILGIWAAAAIPVAILGWIVAPALAPDLASDPIGAAFTRVGLLTLGLVWQFVLSMIIVYREEGDLRWATVRRRLWLNTPRDPKTGEPRARLWLWLVPLLILIALMDVALAPTLDGWWASLFPFFAEPPGFAFGTALGLPEVQAQLVGNWGFLALFAVYALFNTVLGEEFLFRGVLLPKMNGVFGRWDWVANGVLFGVYHLHQPWGILTSVIDGVFLLALPARRFRSTWMAIIVHSGQSVFFLFLILGLVLGLA